jgi:purine-binding chemotaxis protein CheW
MEAQEGKYLTFILGNEEYGILIKRVKEIIGMIMDITNIPRTPEFIKGVINLRGKIIPIMDLRLRFGLPEMEYNQRTCIIVVEINMGEVKKQMGIVVDTVSEVVNIQKNEIDPSTKYDVSGDTDYLMGLGKIKGKVVLLLDIDQILSQDAFVLI